MRLCAFLAARGPWNFTLTGESQGPRHQFSRKDRRQLVIDPGMNFDTMFEALGALSFRQAVWLFPLATALHFLEEAPQFPSWARMHAWPGYTRERWAQIHGAGMAYALAFSTLVSLSPDHLVVFLFFALCLSSIVFNTLFHASATAFFGVYCPGLITSLVIYPPLFWYLSRLAGHEGLLSSSLWLWALAVAGVIHVLDVAVSVFGVRLFDVERKGVRS